MNAKDDITTPRHLAWRWLVNVRDRGADLDAAMPKGLSRLESRDRAFVRLMVLTALRRHGQIDALLATFLKSPISDSAKGLTALLHLGIAQLSFLDVAPHAAVSTAVDIAKTLRPGKFSGLVNAVLRRCVREGAALIAEQDAAVLNTPDWLMDSWVSVYGAETAHQIAAAHQIEAPLDITIRRDPAKWADRLGGSVVGPASVRLVKSGAVEGLEGYRDGAWWVQDVAATLPVRLLGDVSDQRVLDMCAAPGGKTAQLITQGADVTALDQSQPRMKRLVENMQRLGMRPETHIVDALAFSSDERFDAVLLDAPCSATGTIRRHPDIPMKRTPDDGQSMSHHQAMLLRHAATLVKPGGTIIFATCSLQPEEGPGVVGRVLSEISTLQRAPLSSGEFGLNADWITPDGDLRTLPSHMAANGGMDGFFAARLTKVGA